MEKVIFHDSLVLRVWDRLKKDVRICVSLLIIVPLGFSTKFYAGYGQDWVRNSLGGVFYEIFWCLVIYCLFRRLKIGLIVAIVLAGTCGLEFLQLWHPPFLETLRGHFIGRTVLGTSFSWSDFLYYLIGSGIGWYWLKKLSRSGKRSMLEIRIEK